MKGVWRDGIPREVLKTNTGEERIEFETSVLCTDCIKLEGQWALKFHLATQKGKAQFV